MPQAVEARPFPLSIRLTSTERAQLEREAGQCPISTYAKSKIFDMLPLVTRRRVSADQVLLAQVLGQLGASDLATSMGRMADAAASGSLYVDDLTASRLRDACDDIRNMHLLLMQSLGKKVPEEAIRPERLTVQFFKAAIDTRDK